MCPEDTYALGHIVEYSRVDTYIHIRTHIYTYMCTTHIYKYTMCPEDTHIVEYSRIDTYTHTTHIYTYICTTHICTYTHRP
jgi:hypothetical protein